MTLERAAVALAVVAGACVGAITLIVAGIWAEQNETAKRVAAQAHSSDAAGSIEGSKEAGQSVNSDRPTAPRLGGTA